MDAKNQIAEGRRPVFAAADLPENGRIFMLHMQCQPDGQWRGSIHNLYLEQPQTFVGLADAVLKMDGIMDGLDNPQAVTKPRSFLHPVREMQNDSVAQREAYYQWLQEEKKTVRQYWTEASLSPSRPDMVAFVIRVRFRQHSSWQGEVSWKQGKQKIPFRSVLELLHLLQSALQAQQAGKAVKATQEKQT